MIYWLLLNLLIYCLLLNLLNNWLLLNLLQFNPLLDTVNQSRNLICLLVLLHMLLHLLQHLLLLLQDLGRLLLLVFQSFKQLFLLHLNSIWAAFYTFSKLLFISVQGSLRLDFSLSNRCISFFTYRLICSNFGIDSWEVLGFNWSYWFNTLHFISPLFLLLLLYSFDTCFGDVFHHLCHVSSNLKLNLSVNDASRRVRLLAQVHIFNDRLSWGWMNKIWTRSSSTTCCCRFFGRTNGSLLRLNLIAHLN